jgi:hypothetical protein
MLLHLSEQHSNVLHSITTNNPTIMAGNYSDMDPAMLALLEGEKPVGVPRSLSGVPTVVSPEMKQVTDFRSLRVTLEGVQFLGKLRAAAKRRHARNRLTYVDSDDEFSDSDSSDEEREEGAPKGPFYRQRTTAWQPEMEAMLMMNWCGDFKVIEVDIPDAAMSIPVSFAMTYQPIYRNPTPVVPPQIRFGVILTKLRAVLAFRGAVDDVSTMPFKRTTSAYGAGISDCISVEEHKQVILHANTELRLRRMRNQMKVVGKFILALKRQKEMARAERIAARRAKLTLKHHPRCEMDDWGIWSCRRDCPLRSGQIV